MRGCGTCTACCTAMRVDMPPLKPERTRCHHQCATGCGIYPMRPQPCRDFECGWLFSQRSPNPLPAAARPDRTGVVLEINSAGTVIAHCERPGSWMREPLRGWLTRMAGRTAVMLDRPDQPTGLLQHDGTIDEMVDVGVDTETNERLYARASELAAAGLMESRP